MTKIKWVSWWQMFEAKSVGGMGFKKLYIFNMAFLAKQG